MHNSDPKSLYGLSAEQVVIGITLQNEDFQSSVVNYILGLSSIDQLNQKFHSTFRDIQNVEMRESFTNVVTNIFTQKRSFFYILSKVVQVINEARSQIGRDDILRYLSVYEEVITEQGEQFHYIGLPISIYKNIVRRLDRYLGDEEKLVFSILAGCNPNTLQIQLPQNILSALFDIDKIKVVSLFGNFRLNTSRLVDVLISTAIDQGLLFTQISSLLTFFENHGLINRRSNPVNSKSAKNIHLRYIVFRSSVDRGLHDFINEFMHSQLRLSNKNKYFAFIQAVRESRVDILDLIWNSPPFVDRRGTIFTYSVNQQFAFYLAAGHTDETVLN